MGNRNSFGLVHFWLAADGGPVIIKDTYGSKVVVPEWPLPAEK
jgi:hypothetical protein